MPSPIETTEFQLNAGELKPDALIETALKSLRSLPALAVVRAAVSPRFWLAAARTTPDLVVRLIHIQITDVLTGAWKTHRKLKKFADPKQYPPGTASTVPLATHHIKVNQKPYLEITVDGVPQGKIEFDLELDLAIDGGMLVIQDGRIMRLEAGKARLTGTVKCEGVVVVERASREYDWNAGISFREGILISA